jgi:aspartate/methionine/tyrosine aminotransferase
MDLEPFLLDRWLSNYQFASPPIRYDLAASTGPKWTVDEVLALGGDEARARLDALKLSYAPTGGGLGLRTAIAACHGVDPDSVVVTTGASEALLAVFCVFAEPGANVVLPSLVFPAIPVLAGAWGYRLRRYDLSRDEDFEHRADRILSAVDDRTKLVLVNSPHNPTGAVIAASELARLAESLDERRIPLVVDEVYHPLYFDARATTAAVLPNTLVIGDLSKAHSLSGLRVGWVIDADDARRERLIDARGYFTISSSVVTELLAEVALKNRQRLLERLESVARSNLAALDEFVRTNGDVLDWVRPVGGTTAFPWLKAGGDSRPLCESLASHGVLTAPGDCFDAPDHFRIGFGAQASGFGEALAIASEVLRGNHWR